jgi:gas vesicle protein
MADIKRAIPDTLRQTWESATQHPDPRMALQASRGFWRQWARWQSLLVAETLKAGATWDDIGQALGTTRQAAWARFRNVIEETSEGGAMQAQEQVGRLTKEFAESVKVIQERLRSVDAKGQEEVKRLHDQAKLLHEQTRALSKKMADDRKALRNEIRQMIRSAQRQINTLRRGVVDSGAS